MTRSSGHLPEVAAGTDSGAARRAGPGADGAASGGDLPGSSGDPPSSGGDVPGSGGEQARSGGDRRAGGEGRRSTGSNGERPEGAHAASFAARKTRFLAVVSHELRTPLTSIASFTDSLTGDELTAAEQPLALEAVRRNTQRMLALVEDLMLLSRLETGDLPLAADPVDMPALVHAAAEALTRAEPPSAVEVEVAAGPPLRGDAALLHQAVYATTGIVAGHAADRQARLTATAGPQGWIITALARQAEEVTEEHLLASTLAIPDPPPRRRSTALWMLFAEVIVERHGGSLTVDFDPATGASVTTRLPVPAPEPAK